MPLAPIALFVYDRPEHVKKTIETLAANTGAPESELFIFSDGPKSHNADQVEKVRRLIGRIDGFKRIEIIKQDNNLGLAQSIISGVSGLVSRYGKVIVVEDDLILSKYFLAFMNDALTLYENDDAVMHVSGWIPAADTGALPETFFYNKASCWGWATWVRAWRHFNGDAEFLYREIKKRGKMKEFNLDDSAEFSRQLEKNISGKIRTWAIKWQASIFLRDGLCLQPKISLVHNIGNDATGVHCAKTDVYDTEVSDRRINVSRIELAESAEARRLMTAFFKSIRIGFAGKALNKLKSYFHA